MSAITCSSVITVTQLIKLLSIWLIWILTWLKPRVSGRGKAGLHAHRTRLIEYLMDYQISNGNSSRFLFGPIWHLPDFLDLMPWRYSYLIQWRPKSPDNDLRFTHQTEHWTRPARLLRTISAMCSVLRMFRWSRMSKKACTQCHMSEADSWWTRSEAISQSMQCTTFTP